MQDDHLELSNELHTLELIDRKICDADFRVQAGQAFAVKAKQRTSNRPVGKIVIVRLDYTDRYGRLVAEVDLPNRQRQPADARPACLSTMASMVPGADPSSRPRKSLRGAMLDSVGTNGYLELVRRDDLAA
jgi:hypothetical protein